MEGAEPRLAPDRNAIRPSGVESELSGRPKDQSRL